MKQILLLLALALATAKLHAQPYPFQNPGLDDEVRLDNLISLMTLDEKINCLSTRPSVPRLGISGTRIVEGLHGLALSGPANWAVRNFGDALGCEYARRMGLPVKKLVMPTNENDEFPKEQKKQFLPHLEQAGHKHRHNKLFGEEYDQN